MGWTPERTDIACRLWDEGFSFGLIAEELGVTRNAVAGKLNGLGLVGDRRETVKSKEKTSRKQVKDTSKKEPEKAMQQDTKEVQKRPAAQPAAKSQKVKVSRPDNQEEAPPAPRLTGVQALLNHDSRRCKWIYGDTSTDQFYFCCTLVENGPYCSEHAAAVYIPHEKRQKKRRRDFLLYGQ